MIYIPTVYVSNGNSCPIRTIESDRIRYIFISQMDYMDLCKRIDNRVWCIYNG
jgi:hypothetical protein